MNARFRIATFATLALFLLALVFGARHAVRSLSAPFDGWERFARSPKSPVVEPDSEFSDAIQEIDWPDPPAVASEDPTAPDALKVLATASRESPRLAATLLANAAHAELQATQIAVDVTLYFGLAQEHDIESLAASLKLSDSQKARIANLMEWKRWSLESLAGVEQSDEMVKTIEDGYREAMKLELDLAQARDYEKLTAPRGVDLRGERILALTPERNGTVSRSLLRFMGSAVEEKAPSGE